MTDKSLFVAANSESYKFADADFNVTEDGHLVVIEKGKIVAAWASGNWQEARYLDSNE
ncbi:MAG: hypothetical protein V1850_02615 [Candidatus Bathyarchaeota archaeon]